MNTLKTLGLILASGLLAAPVFAGHPHDHSHNHREYVCHETTRHYHGRHVYYGHSYRDSHVTYTYYSRQPRHSFRYHYYEHPQRYHREYHYRDRGATRVRVHRGFSGNLNVRF